MSNIYPVLLTNSYEENCLITRKDDTDDATMLTANRNMFSEYFCDPYNPEQWEWSVCCKYCLITVQFHSHALYALDSSEF